MKLLAKTAEERDQTASGVANDLRRCPTESETQHRIDEFRGEQDIPETSNSVQREDHGYVKSIFQRRRTWDRKLS